MNHGAGNVRFLLNAIAYYHYLIQHFVVFYKHHFKIGLVLNGDFLSLVADITDLDNSRFRAHHSV